MNTKTILKAVTAVLMPAIAGTFITLGSAPPAEAAGDNCKNVSIKVINDRQVEIKVTKIEYYDYDKAKWRREASINKKIARTKSFTWRRDLEHVKNDPTKVRITYKDNLGGNRWGSSRTETGSKHTCRKDERLTFRAN